ncbi:MAG: integrating conjugative element protein [Cocleimonas sp.]
MNFKLKKTVLLMSLLCFSYSVNAVDVPPENKNLVPPSLDGLLYYEIGGANSLMLPMYNKSRFKLKGGLVSNGNLMCSDLDPDISISNMVNGLKSGWASLQRNMTNSVKGTVSSLPGLALHYINPGLYDMINSMLLSGEDQFQAEVASCQRITDELMKSKPNYEFVKASGYEKYRDFFTEKDEGAGEGDKEKEPESKSADAGAVVKNMEKDLGKEGITWICGDKRGGEGQLPIKMSETVWAGYNRLIDRGECETIAPAKSDDNPTYVSYWEKPTDAQKWLIDVFGETEIYTDPNKAPRKTKPGTGLMLMIEETSKVIVEDLTSLVDEYRNDFYEPSLRDLQSVSAPGTIITKEVIYAIANSADSNMYIKRLAVDMATQRELLKALEMRRLLYSSSMTNEISQIEPVKNNVDYWMKALFEEVKIVKEEMELRKFLNQNTIPTILKSDYYNRKEAL